MSQPAKNISDVVAYRMCHGCGACAWVCPNDAIELRNFSDDGIRPVRDPEQCDDCGDCVGVCSGVRLDRDRAHWHGDVAAELADSWGPVLELWEGHAGDKEIRFKGSSGGVATAMGLYCIERGGMYGVLHAGADTERPYLSQAVLSRTRDELAQRTGSRYGPVAVCGQLGLVDQAPAPVMLLAKPCDIAAAGKACEIRPDLARNIGLTVAVFCGGTPSTRGTLEILERLGAEPADVAELRYRGCGWPGCVSARLKTNANAPLEMPYHEAWDTILAKRRPLRCLMCPDGTGEFADIACGDPWYRQPASDEEGTTLIVVRTQKGRDALGRAISCGYVVAEPRSKDVLEQSQRALLNRRRHVWPKVVALRLTGQPAPQFKGFSLWRDWLRLPAARTFVSLARSFRLALGLRRRGPVRCETEADRDSLPVRPRIQPTEPSSDRVSMAAKNV